MRPDLVHLCGQFRRVNDGLRAQCRQCGKRGRASALGVGAGGIELVVMVVARMILAEIAMRSMRVGIAEHDGELAVDRRQHKAGGNERAQAQHREHPGRRPMRLSPKRALRTAAHGLSTCVTEKGASTGDFCSHA